MCQRLLASRCDRRSSHAALARQATTSKTTACKAGQSQMKLCSGLIPTVARPQVQGRGLRRQPTCPAQGQRLRSHPTRSQVSSACAAMLQPCMLCPTSCSLNELTKQQAVHVCSHSHTAMMCRDQSASAEAAQAEAYFSDLLSYRCATPCQASRRAEAFAHSLWSCRARSTRA